MVLTGEKSSKLWCNFLIKMTLTLVSDRYAVKNWLCYANFFHRFCPCGAKPAILAKIGKLVNFCQNDKFDKTLLRQFAHKLSQ